MMRPPPAPEREADADFVPACRAAQHQQVRHVRTHDERDETGEAEEHREQRREPLRRTDIERLDVRLASRVFRIRGGEAAADHPQFLARLQQRHPLAQPADRLQPAGFTGLERAGLAGQHGMHRDRDPDVEREADKRPAETGRSDADDRDVDAIEPDVPADRGRFAAEALHPQPMADDGQRRLFRDARLARRERAPERRRHTEHVEVVVRDQKSPDGLGPAAAVVPLARSANCPKPKAASAGMLCA